LEEALEIRLGWQGSYSVLGRKIKKEKKKEKMWTGFTR
jgi:hypothetical protein